jgi:hypothetical protein
MYEVDAYASAKSPLLSNEKEVLLSGSSRCVSFTALPYYLHLSRTTKTTITFINDLYSPSSCLVLYIRIRSGDRQDEKETSGQII